MAYTYEDYKKMYAEKKRTLQECLDMIQSGDHIQSANGITLCQHSHTSRPEGLIKEQRRSFDGNFFAEIRRNL